MYGERWRVHADGGELSGDELEDSVIEIRNDGMPPGFILAAEEAEWLSEAWKDLTGRELTFPAFTQLMLLMREK